MLPLSHGGSVSVLSLEPEQFLSLALGSIGAVDVALRRCQEFGEDAKARVR